MRRVSLGSPLTMEGAAFSQWATKALREIERASFVPDSGQFSDPVQLPSYTVSALPDGMASMVAFASDGRKNGEGAAAGTGVMVFHDGTAWRACDTGATVAA